MAGSAKGAAFFALKEHTDHNPGGYMPMSRLPETGQTLWGFTVTERNTISMLGAETAELFHPFSGARLFIYT